MEALDLNTTMQNGSRKPAKKPGAPMGNGNATKNGLRSLAATGRVPTTIKGGLWIRRQVRKLRREVQREFVALHQREPTIHEHIVLKTLCRAEARAMIHEKILAEKWNDLTYEQQTMALDRVGSAGDQLIRCSEKLGLNQTGKADDPWKAIPASVVPAGESEAPEAGETVPPESMQ